jgi:hypothetical protein
MRAASVSAMTDRLEIMASSLEGTRHRFEEARANAVAAMRLYHEALIVLGEDDDDDFATAFEKKDKFDRIEAELLATGEVYTSALNRLGWELRNSGAETAR